MTDVSPMTEVIVALGSNIKPQDNIPNAMAKLDEMFNLVKKARSLHTKPVDVVGEQPDFINTGCLLNTQLTQEELRKQLKQIEQQMGRESISSDEPRIIDLDIIVWDGVIIDKDVYSRDFLQTIVIELLPNLGEQLSATNNSE
ncbi:MAG: 2-amino-4-hydroxy-6-hydroxymethyldihydropteridine diphosphokinase [Candidatus Portiera sp.]|nr:2-amino-4-hydroxy-6-hydroxymethyldihydropteridine diphosphokinase [Portiera sp.]